MRGEGERDGERERDRGREGERERQREGEREILLFSRTRLVFLSHKQNSSFYGRTVES